ncbi:MAG: F0F1 ATP synthase subunit gamma [Lachnospiraceae bacterium]|nr:F0F1 ATP synthase subunit gamma [Lachnospiraceae bacterium]
MNNIRAVVKVMNFHSLLRVNKSRDDAKKYIAMEEILTEMIDSIMNNRNIILDSRALKVNPDNPKLHIYIGSDMGFCANINSQVKRAMSEAEGVNTENIIIGRKLVVGRDVESILYQTREEYDSDPSTVLGIIEDAIRTRKYSSITITYNHYYNSSNVDMVTKQLFPMEKTDNSDDHKEDFTIEGDADELLQDLMVLYSKYFMEIAASTSSAAENINRQSVTTQSLHKIDERDEVRKIENRRAENDKKFAKVLSSYTNTIGR